MVCKHCLIINDDDVETLLSSISIHSGLKRLAIEFSDNGSLTDSVLEALGALMVKLTLKVLDVDFCGCVGLENEGFKKF